MMKLRGYLISTWSYEVVEGQVDRRRSRRRSSTAGALEAVDLLPSVHTTCLQQAGMSVP
jgi:hypothetical protein